MVRFQIPFVLLDWQYEFRLVVDYLQLERCNYWHFRSYIKINLSNCVPLRYGVLPLENQGHWKRSVQKRNCLHISTQRTISEIQTSWEINVENYGCCQLWCAHKFPMLGSLGPWYLPGVKKHQEIARIYLQVAFILSLCRLSNEGELQSLREPLWT